MLGSLRTAALSLALLVPLTAAGAQSVHHVDSDAPAGGDGASWATAFASLDLGLAGAQAGDEVRVAAGVYRPAGASFVLAEGVRLRGGFAGLGAADPDEQNVSLHVTTLDGDVAGDDVPFELGQNRGDNVDHVVTVGAGTAECLLEGVTVRGGHSSSQSVGGACVQMDGGVLRLDRCTLQDAFSRRYAAGLAVTGGATAVVDHCTFDRLAAGFANGLDAPSGGAMRVDGDSSAVVRDSTFTDNEVRGPQQPSIGLGGALTIVGPSAGVPGTRVERCHFEGNWCHDVGGAVNAGGDVAFVDCTFFDNSIGPGGGAFPTAFGSAAAIGGGVQMVRCRMVGNSGGAFGGIGSAVNMSGPGTALVACEVLGDGATGGGVVVSQGDGAVITGCTISGAFHQFFTAGLTIAGAATNTVVSNNVIWGNVNLFGASEGAQITVDSASADFSHNLVQGWSGAAGGVGNHGGDPLFVDLDGPDDVRGTLDDDPRLGAGSAAIDAGDSGALPADTGDTDCDGDLAEPLPMDLGGLTRAVDDPATPDTGLGSPVVDAGAHEFGAGLPDDAWVDLGGGSPGALGQPMLAGAGTFCEGQWVSLELTNAPPHEFVLLIESISSTPVPKWGGVVYPVPIWAQFLLVTDGGGEILAQAPLIDALPPGIPLYYQYLVRDTTVSPQIILSNSVHTVTP
jgi:hypothetical protein